MITNPVIPIVLENNRGYDKDFKGFVYFCDIDKTYLDTRFETVSGLISTLLDFAVDKVNISGMDYLIKGVRRNNEIINGVYFISASPKEMKNIISKKLLLDGVQFDGICLRDQLYYMKKLKFKSLKRPFSFKLLALLTYNSLLPDGLNYVLIGDNTESDADIYKTFQSILKEGKINIKTLRKFIQSEEEIIEIMDFQDKIKSGSVERIYINRYVKGDVIKGRHDSVVSVQGIGASDIRYYDHSIEVMLDLYKIGQMDEFFIKKAYYKLDFDINLISKADKKILKGIIK